MKIIKKVLTFLSSIAEDFCIFVGLILIIKATFILGYILGLYVLGFILVFLGLILARKSK